MKKILAWLSANWRFKAFIAGAILFLAAAGFLVFAVSQRNDRNYSSGAASEEHVTPDVPLPRSYSNLYAVAIDNHVDARPASGLARSPIVFELPVEGGITRFLAFFEKGGEITELGPVRSARPYFLDLISEFGYPLFLHFGGSPAALEKIASSSLFTAADRDGMGAAGNGFWRDLKKEMPHNAYTSSAKVEAMFAVRGGGERVVTPWLFSQNIKSEQNEEASFVAPVGNGPSYSPEWRYQKEKNLYVRYVAGKEQVDAAGEVLAAENVVVMSAAVKTLDSIGRLSVNLFGEGEATVYRAGEAVAAKWKNEEGGSPMRFYGSTGAEIVFSAGRVWIEVVKK
jgi:hypothetical protein